MSHRDHDGEKVLLNLKKIFKTDVLNKNVPSNKQPLVPRSNGIEKHIQTISGYMSSSL